MSLSTLIKEFALDLGYSKVGFTTADDFIEYHDILSSRESHYDWYINSGAQPLAHTKIRDNFQRRSLLLRWYGIIPKYHSQKTF